jgi:hypothetical protein
LIQAVNEINDKSDGIADNLLPGSQIKVAIAYGSGFTGAVIAVGALLGSFDNTGLKGIVGSMSDESTEAADLVSCQ